jgi:outer membrane protein assembly factor BamA
VIQSWQSIGNLGFFETPMPPPDQRRVNEQGDIDLIFRVKEKRTGNVNFGASMGQGTGFGGSSDSISPTSSVSASAAPCSGNSAGTSMTST